MGAQVWEAVSQFGKALVSRFASGQRGAKLELCRPHQGTFSISTMVSYQLKSLHLITSFDSDDPI